MDEKYDKTTHRLQSWMVFFLMFSFLAGCKALTSGGNVEKATVDQLEVQVKHLEKDHLKCYDKLNESEANRKDITDAYASTFRTIGKLKDQAKKGD